MLEDVTIKELRKVFPKEAIQIYKKLRDPKTGEEKILVGYKPQYIIERLNDAFGHENWDFEVKQLKMDDSCAWCHGTLTIYMSRANEDSLSGPLIRSVMTKKDHIGSCEFYKGISYGDALKGAVTNCIEKCASMLDIGQDAYKGLVEAPDELKKSLSPVTGESEPVSNRTSLIAELKDQCKKAEIGKEAFKVLTKNVLGESKDAKDIDDAGLTKLINHVKTNGSPF